MKLLPVDLSFLPRDCIDFIDFFILILSLMSCCEFSTNDHRCNQDPTASGGRAFQLRKVLRTNSRKSRWCFFLQHKFPPIRGMFRFFRFTREDAFVWVENYGKLRFKCTLRKLNSPEKNGRWKTFFFLPGLNMGIPKCSCLY